MDLGSFIWHNYLQYVNETAEDKYLLQTFLCMLGKLAIGWLKSGIGRYSSTKVGYIREVDIMSGVTLCSITS